SGRARVRAIRPSRSRSIHWFSELAPAAERAVPATHPVARIRSSVAVQLRPKAAKANPTPDVTVTKRVIRGLVVSTRAARAARAGSVWVAAAWIGRLKGGLRDGAFRSSGKSTVEQEVKSIPTSPGRATFRGGGKLVGRAGERRDGSAMLPPDV